jgi:hypothetical protein
MKRKSAPKRANEGLFPGFARVFADFFGKEDRQKNRHDDNKTDCKHAQKASFAAQQFLQHGSLLLQGW